MPRSASLLTVTRLLARSVPTLRYFPNRPHHLACDQVMILSSGFAPLQGITRTAPPTCVSAISPSLEVPSPSAHWVLGVRFTRGSQTSARSDFRVSHPLAGLLLPAPLGFISPRWHSWGSALQGFFLIRSRATLPACALPSWHFLRTVTVAMALPTVGAPVSRS